MQVSIPFVAGHWFPPRVSAPGHGGVGAVSIPFVAGHWFPPVLVGADEDEDEEVSIPFVAGHWFPPSIRSRRSCRSRMFQSPS